jgi:hypothetical protein
MSYNTVRDVEAIINDVMKGLISRSVANGLIRNVLTGVEPLIIQCGQCGKEHVCTND